MGRVFCGMRPELRPSHGPQPTRRTACWRVEPGESRPGTVPREAPENSTSASVTSARTFPGADRIHSYHSAEEESSGPGCAAGRRAQPCGSVTRPATGGDHPAHAGGRCGPAGHRDHQARPGRAFASYSVMPGFLSGIAVNIIASQIPDLAGTKASGSFPLGWRRPLMPRSIREASARHPGLFCSPPRSRLLAPRAPSNSCLGLFPVHGRVVTAGMFMLAALAQLAAGHGVDLPPRSPSRRTGSSAQGERCGAADSEPR